MISIKKELEFIIDKTYENLNKENNYNTNKEDPNKQEYNNKEENKEDNKNQQKMKNIKIMCLLFLISIVKRLQ